MNIVSLFAGIAGFDLAFSRAGFHTSVTCEIDPNCQTLLADKFPGAQPLDDITKINAVHRRLTQHPAQPIPNYESKWKPIFDSLSTADVFCGGFPCQDLSVAGQRAGLAGGRSGLWFAFRRVIALFRPPWLVIENVPGLLSSNQGGDMSILLRGLSQLGYRWAYRSFDAQYFDLAQRRERVFIVAHSPSRKRSLDPLPLPDERRILQMAAQILFEPQSLCGDPPPSRAPRQRTAPTIEGRAGRSGENEFATSGGLVEVPVTANPIGSHHRRDDLDHDTFAPQANIAITHSLSSEGADASEDGTGRGTPIVLAHGQANAECVSDGSPSLTCNHEAPIALIPIQEVSKRTGSGGQGQNGCGIGNDGDPMFTLQSKAQHAIAFSSKDSGNDASPDLSPTLRSQNFKDSHMNGGGQVAIAFDTTQLTSKDNYSSPKPGAACHPLASKAHPPAIAFPQNLSATQCAAAEDLAPVLQSDNPTAVAFPRDLLNSLALQGIIERIGNANATKADAETILLSLREAHGEKAFSDWGTNVLASLQAAEVLRPPLHGRSVAEPQSPDSVRHRQRKNQSQAKEGSGTVRTVRKTKREGRSPQGPEHIQQFADQFRAYLSRLPQSDSSKASSMQNMWQTREGIGILQHALSALQDLGRSDGSEGQPTHSKEKGFGVSRAMQVRRLTPT